GWASIGGRSLFFASMTEWSAVASCSATHVSQARAGDRANEKRITNAISANFTHRIPLAAFVPWSAILLSPEQRLSCSRANRHKWESDGVLRVATGHNPKYRARLRPRSSQVQKRKCP